MRRRLIIGGAVGSGVLFACLLGYRLLDLPPIKLALRHGLTTTAAPTGRSCVRGRHKFIELSPGITCVTVGDWLPTIEDRMRSLLTGRENNLGELTWRNIWIERTQALWISEEPVPMTEVLGYDTAPGDLTNPRLTEPVIQAFLWNMGEPVRIASSEELKYARGAGVFLPEAGCADLSSENSKRARSLRHVFFDGIKFPASGSYSRYRIHLVLDKPPR